MIATLSPLANTAITIACLFALVGLGVVISRMFKAIRDDRERLDERDRKEMEHWNE